MKPLRFLRSNWEWLVLTFTLLTLALFLAGYDLFGFSGLVSSVLALIGAVAGAILSFLIATLVIPIIALVTGAITALIAAVTGLIAILVGGIFTPLAALFAGWVGAIFTWLAGTWLGTLLMPVYNLLGPLIIKIAPWITVSKTATRIWKTGHENSFFRQFLRRFSGRKPRRQPASASRNAAPGRSSAPAKRRHAPKPRRRK